MWASGDGRCSSQLIATFLLSVSPLPHSLSIKPRKRRMKVSGELSLFDASWFMNVFPNSCEYGVIMGFGFNLFHIISAR